VHERPKHAPWNAWERWKIQCSIAVLTGIDFNQFGDKSAKFTEPKGGDKDDFAEKAKSYEEMKKKKEDDAKKKAEEAKFSSMTEEEKELERKKNSCEELKNAGNELYKEKDYESALSSYQAALSEYDDLNVRLNICNVYIATEKYKEAIDEAEYILNNTFDFNKKAKAYAKIGFAWEALGEYGLAIEAFDKSSFENGDPRIKDKLREVQKKKKVTDEAAYIDPEKAEEANHRANELYKAGAYQKAIEEYNDSIKRSPTCAKYYANRAAFFIKLAEFSKARDDCDKSIELDPNVSKVYSRKAVCHKMMKEYHKSLDAYEKGLKIFPSDSELLEGKNKILMDIQNSSGEDDEERSKRAQQDPEIQGILRDPRITQLLKDFQENPKEANKAIQKDAWIREAFNKLVASGIVKTK